MHLNSLIINCLGLSLASAATVPQAPEDKQLDSRQAACGCTEDVFSQWQVRFRSYFLPYQEYSYEQSHVAGAVSGVEVEVELEATIKEHM